MTTELSPAMLVEQATIARIAALQDTLRRFRREHGDDVAPSRAMAHPAATQPVEADTRRRLSRNDETTELT